MDYATRSRLHLFWLLISLTIVFAPGLGASETDAQATGTRVIEGMAPKILAPLSEEAVTTDVRPKVSQLSSEEAIVLVAAVGLVAAQLAAIRAGKSPGSIEPQTAGTLVPSRGPPSGSD
jgi:hypothetical protein